MSRPWRIAAEIAAWSLFIAPLAALLTARRLLGYGRGVTPAERADALVRWYPRAWRARHGADLRQTVLDAIEGGHDGLGLALDVAREGLVERARAVRWERVRSGFLVGLGWTMFFPQGVVAAVLSQFDVPPGWFLALQVGGDEQWLVMGAMVGVGLLLVDRGMHGFAVDCARRKARATQ